MADPQQELIDNARLGAAVRSQTALLRMGGIVPSAPPIIRPGLTPVTPVDAPQSERARARDFAIRIFNEPDPDMDKVVEIVRKIRDRLSTPNFPTLRSDASDTHCRGFEAYVLGNRPPVHLCPVFFSTTDEQRIRTLIHETAHLVGIGEPDGESYYPFFDGQPLGNGLGPNSADSWAHFIHCVSGQALDKPDNAGGHTAKTPPPTATKIHTVVPGDYLTKIAKHYYGDPQMWRKIYDANRAVIGPNPDKIFPGQKLIIP